MAAGADVGLETPPPPPVRGMTLHGFAETRKR